MGKISIFLKYILFDIMVPIHSVKNITEIKLKYIQNNFMAYYIPRYIDQ